MQRAGHRLEDLSSEFEQAVFLAAYHSSEQTRRRQAALVLLAIKHGLRGLMFSWPAYVLALAAGYSDGLHAFAYLLLLIPAIALSAYILFHGVRDDYRVRVDGFLLNKKFMRTLLWPQNSISI